jgi:hypothetical protein
MLDSEKNWRVTAMKGRILLAAIFILALSWRGGFAADYYTLSGATDAGAYANCNGNYYLHSIDSDGNPVYKHESQNYYLYLGFFMADYFWLIDVDLNDDDWHFGYYRNAYGSTLPLEGEYNYWDARGALPILSKYTDASLPVGLASFSASQKGSSVVLAWVTESEVDNAGFILERSEDRTSWTTVASYLTHDALKGKGNTSSRTEYSFTDTGIQTGKTYQYRLSDVSTAGVATAYAPISIKTDALPEKTEMENAYPNPFNPQTFIAYRLARETDVNIAVFDMLGLRVKTLYNGHQYTGSYHVYWDGTNEAGRRTPSGGYVIRMKTESVTQTQKVMLTK